MGTQHVTHSFELKKKDGTTAIHTAEALEHKPLSDGAISIKAGCCGDPSTESWHTFYDVAKMSEADIRSQIEGHVKRVAEHHAGHDNALDVIATMLKPKGL